MFVLKWDQGQARLSQGRALEPAMGVKLEHRVTPMTPLSAMVILSNQTNLAVLEGMDHLAKVKLLPFILII
jgi:hypothetical protein